MKRGDATCNPCNGRGVIAVVNHRLIYCSRCAGKGWVCPDGKTCRDECGDVAGDKCIRAFLERD